MFSIVIPAYNAEATLAETLESVLAQAFRDFEVVVVDDGSTDATSAIVGGFVENDSRIHLISKENGGIGSAYNAGIASSKGEWIVMLSADDLLMPTHLAELAEKIEVSPEADLISVNGYYLFDDGQRSIVYEKEPWFGSDSCSLENLLDRCFFPVGAAFSRQAYFDAGGFETRLYAEDYYLFLRILALGYTHAYISTPLAIHRRNRRQRSSAGLAMREGDIATLERVRDEFPLTADECKACEAAIARHRKNIGIRKVLYRILGSNATEKLITLLRGE